MVTKEKYSQSPWTAVYDYDSTITSDYRIRSSGPDGTVARTAGLILAEEEAANARLIAAAPALYEALQALQRCWELQLFVIVDEGHDTEVTAAFQQARAALTVATEEP